MYFLLSLMLFSFCQHSLTQTPSMYSIFHTLLFSSFSVFFFFVFVTGALRHAWERTYTSNILITNKKYTLSYVYWDHTNTSQGYIDVKNYSLFTIFFIFSSLSFASPMADCALTLSDLTRFYSRSIFLLLFLFSYTLRWKYNFLPLVCCWSSSFNSSGPF